MKYARPDAVISAGAQWMTGRSLAGASESPQHETLAAEPTTPKKPLLLVCAAAFEGTAAFDR